MSQEHKQKEAGTNPNQARTFYYVNMIFLCALTLFSLLFSLIVYFRLRTAGSDGIRRMYTEKQIRNLQEAAADRERRELLLRIQTALESGRSTTGMLQEVFDGSIVAVRGGRYYFYPAAEGAEKNPLEPASLVKRGDEVLYTGDVPGIEISSGVLLSDDNGKVDWDRLAASRVREVTVRAGTVTAKGFSPDSQLDRNCRKAVEKKMQVRLCVDLGEPADREVLEEAAEAVRGMYEAYGVRRRDLAVSADDPDGKETADGHEKEDAAGDGDGADRSGGSLDPVVILRVTSPEPDDGTGLIQEGESAAPVDTAADSTEPADASMNSPEPERAAQTAEPEETPEGTVPDASLESTETGAAADSTEPQAAMETADERQLRKEWTKTLRLLCTAVEDAGGRPVPGAGLYTFAAQVDMSELGRYDRWLTDHGDYGGFPYSFSFWEYSAEGSLDGVPGQAVLYACIQKQQMQ